MIAIAICLAVTTIFSSCNRENEPDILIDPELLTDAGVVINGIRWATHNVDAPGTFTRNPEDAGMFYQWNRRVGWSSTDPLINSNGGTEWDNTRPGGAYWTRANCPCPQGWRVPTVEELQSLLNAIGELTIQNGVYGRFFGTTPYKLFLPASDGRGHNGNLSSPQIWGGYWSNERTDGINHSITAHYLIITRTFNVITHNNCWVGRSVRCVSDN